MKGITIEIDQTSKGIKRIIENNYQYISFSKQGADFFLVDSMNDFHIPKKKEAVILNQVPTWLDNIQISTIQDIKWHNEYFE